MNRAVWAVGCAVALLLVGCGSTATKTVTVTSGSAASGTSTGGSSNTAASTTGGSSTTAASTTGASTTTASGSLPLLRVGTFRSPSGNIGCAIVAGLARCDIQHRSWSPGPRPSTCPHIVDYGQGLNVGNAGVGRLVCAGDTVMVPTAPKLAYGRSTAVAGFRCDSTPAGITCTNTSTGHGFFISIQSYRAF